MKWFIICTRRAAEIKVCRKLAERGIEAYCPTYKDIRQWSDRKKKVERPYFNSYVFVKLNEKDRREVFCIPGVVCYLFWLGKPAVVREAEMDLLRKYLDAGGGYEVKITDWSPGDEVTFARGLLKDKHGVLEEVGPRTARLFVPALGCRVMVRMVDLV